MRRQLVESPLYAARRQVLQPDARRLDDLLDGLTTALASDAEKFFQIDATTNIWIAKTDAQRDAPALRVWYTFDTTTVELLYVELVEDLL